MDGKLFIKNIDLLLKIILQSKNIHGADLDLLVETIKELNKMKQSILNSK